MALKPAVCTQCGASIEVDDTMEAGICRHCGTAFITEKVIANYTNNYSTVHNITNNVTKIINGGKDSDDAEDFFNRGLTNLKLKKNWDAEDNFIKAIELSPEVAKYYFYKYIANGYDSRAFVGTDAESFFTLATQQEKQDLGKEYGIDLTDLNTAVYSSCKRACIEKKFIKGQLEYIVNGKYIDFGSESYAKLCNDYCERQIEIYNQDKSYKELESLTWLKQFFVKGENEEVNAKLYELTNKVNDIATKGYCKKIGNTLYLLNRDYIPKEYKNNDTLKIADPSVNNIVFGAFVIEINNFILTKNIQSINCFGYNLFKDGYKLEDIGYSQETAPIWTKYLTVEEDCDEQTAFNATENIIANCVIVPATFKRAEFKFKYASFWAEAHLYLKILGKDTKVNSYVRKKANYGYDKINLGYVKNGKLYLPTNYNKVCCYYDKIDNEFCKFIKDYEPEVLENYTKKGGLSKKDYNKELNKQEKMKRMLIGGAIGLGIIAFIAFIVISVLTGL